MSLEGDLVLIWVEVVRVTLDLTPTNPRAVATISVPSNINGKANAAAAIPFGSDLGSCFLNTATVSFRSADAADVTADFTQVRGRTTGHAFVQIFWYRVVNSTLKKQA